MNYLSLLLFFHSSVAFTILCTKYQIFRPLRLSIEDDNRYEEHPSFQVTSHDRSTFITNHISQTYKDNSIRNDKVVWLIDDEQAILDAVSSYLHSAGYIVRTYLNASTPLSLIENFNTMPDAIVCDINMPIMTGLDFLAKLRLKPITNSLPFIFLTAKGNLEDRIRGYDYGTDCYLMKPFDPEELLAILDTIIERKVFVEKDQSIGFSLEEIRDDLREVKELLKINNRDNSGSFPNKRQTDGEQHRNNRVVDEFVELTKDDLRVLELLTQGYMNREIALKIGYSTAWVEKHLTDLYRKTGQNNRTTLVRWAISNKYVKL